MTAASPTRLIAWSSVRDSLWASKCSSTGKDVGLEGGLGCTSVSAVIDVSIAVASCTSVAVAVDDWAICAPMPSSTLPRSVASASARLAARVSHHSTASCRARLLDSVCVARPKSRYAVISLCGSPRRMYCRTGLGLNAAMGLISDPSCCATLASSVYRRDGDDQHRGEQIR